jgi:NAD(P)-dependent dehydrogenase (short-subunit alcohol dehydrogenase family)
MNAIVESGWVQSIWRDAKRWRRLPLGPVNLVFKFARRHQATFFGSLLRTHASGVAEQINGELKGSPQSTPDFKQTSSPRGSAVLVGVGPGLGEAIATHLARKGLPLALVSRSASTVEAFALHLQTLNPRVAAYPCDATDERSVTKLMRDVVAKLGVPEIVIYAVQDFSPGSLLTTEVAAFEEGWRTNCLGAFIVAREAARSMQPLGRGTILFAGATSGTIGRKGYINLAVGKFGLRALSQVIARELAPQRIHVAHILIDGDIAEEPQPTSEPQIQPEELADLFWSLHQQPKSCWTSELDVRPSDEQFWEHC